MSAKLNVLLLLPYFAVLVAPENVTTIFQLEPASAAKGGYESYGTWRVVTTNGARGFPVRKGNIGMANVWAGQPCCETWSREGWTKLSDQEALQQNPPLDVGALESADSKSLAKASEDARQYKQDSAGVWRGTMLPDSRVRLTFVPPEIGRAALGIFLCGAEGVGDVQCVAVVITGSSANGKTLRYQATRYGSKEAGSRRPTPNGNLKTHVVRRDDRVREGWLGNNTYNFRIQRTAAGDLEVQLDGGDPTQRRQMAIAGGFPYSKIAVLLLSAASDIARDLRVTEDTAWQGDLSPGSSIKVTFSPNSNNIGHLGFAFCEDRFRENCNAQVIDGIAGGNLVRAEPPYWTAGTQEADKPMSDSSRNARWGKSKYTFTLTRGHDGTVTISVDGEAKYTWLVPANYQFLVIDTYHNEGTAHVDTATEKISASVWRLDRESGELRSPPIPEYYVEGEVCVSVAARVSKGSATVISVQRYSGNKDGRDLDTLTSKAGTQWIQKRITIPPSRILQKNKVQIVLTARQPAQTNSPILVQWAAGCNPSGRSDEISIKGFVASPTLQNEIGFRSNEWSEDTTTFFGVDFSPRSHNVCQNDGYITKDAKCLCRPGFTGRLCERACGPNRFGDNCENRCSDEFSPRECRGMWLCTRDLPCDCAPGLKGPRCDQPCEHGKYGVGCRQECGQCSYGNTCDPYTGVCTTGCSGSRLPPFCKAQCGRPGLVAAFIGGGKPAQHNQYPWHVGIYDKNYIPEGSDARKGSIEQVCGGTVITPNIVISAAHCFWDGRTNRPRPAERYAVAFAKLKRGWDAKEEKPQEIQKRDIDAIHIPIDFRGIVDSKEDDIAVVELKNPVDRTPYVVPACFDQVGGYEEVLREGSVGYVAGWGRNQDNIPSEDLKEARFAFISREECLRVAVDSFRPYITAKDRFCAGEHGGTYVNRGDSGGGLVFPQADVYFLRGVVSAAAPNEKTFSAYTNVSYHRDWIVTLTQTAELRKAYKEVFLSG